MRTIAAMFLSLAMCVHVSSHAVPIRIKTALTRAVFDRLVCDRLIDELCNGRLADAYVTFPVWDGKIDETALRMTVEELLQLYASRNLPAHADVADPVLTRIKEKTAGDGWKIYAAKIANYGHVLIRLFDDGRADILEFSDAEKRFPSSMTAYRLHVARVKAVFRQAPDNERRYADADISTVIRFYYSGEYFNIDGLSGGTFDPASPESIAAKRRYGTLLNWWLEGVEERAAYRRNLPSERDKTDTVIRTILIKAENLKDVRDDWGGYKDVVTEGNMPAATKRFLSAFWDGIPEQ